MTFASRQRSCWCSPWYRKGASCCLRSGGHGAGARSAAVRCGVRYHPYEAAAGADALLILTEWEEFATLDLKRLTEHACAIRS